MASRSYPPSSTEITLGGFEALTPTQASSTSSVALLKSSSSNSQSARGSSVWASKPALRMTRLGLNRTISATTCRHLVLNWVRDKD